jgi:hypothetical protein
VLCINEVMIFDAKMYVINYKSFTDFDSAGPTPYSNTIFLCLRCISQVILQDRAQFLRYNQSLGVDMWPGT